MKPSKIASGKQVCTNPSKCCKEIDALDPNIGTQEVEVSSQIWPGRQGEKETCEVTAERQNELAL